MRKTKQNNLLLVHGFILVTILATAKSAEAEITMEAAFQGHCGHTSPCEQLCYEIHDGMYECDCIEGYELNKNGYSCQVINSTSNGDGHSKSDEDVLYQKGASFSAKLANNDNERDNQLSSGYASAASLSSSSSATGAASSDEEEVDAEMLYSDEFVGLPTQAEQQQQQQQQQNVNSNDYYISAETINFSSGERAQLARYNSNEPVAPVVGVSSSTTAKPANATTSKSTTTTATTPSLNTEAMSFGNMEEYDYYSKQDMSIYDDVNNNQLNLRPLSHNTYQDQRARHVETQQISISKDKLSSNEAAKVPQTDAAATNISKDNANISDDVSSTRTATTTSTSCPLDCGLDGICSNIDGENKCLCPFGKTGNNCLEDTKVGIPKFSQKSWLAFPALRGAYKHVQIRVEFRPGAFDGIILLSGERDDLTGDFMALLLNKGFVEFWFDCGSGVGSVRSRETILLNEWNSVIIYRHRWDAWLVLNHGTKVQGRSNGLFSRITFREPVFLGGTGNITGLAKRLPVYNGFVGCIRRFVANEHDYKFEEHPLGDVTKGFDIQDCVTDKCFKYPCQHGGKCLPSDQGAVCLCPIGFVGDLCEIRMDLQVPSFNGSSYLRYAPLGDSALIWLELKVILKPEQPDGLILYSGPEKRGDFIALSLNGGFVEFTFDLGSGPALVRSEYPLSIGQWHTIKVSRTARLAVLKINQLPEIMTISSNGFWHLSLPESIFLGGVNHVDKLPFALKYKSFFVGCIQKIDINGHALAIISEALGGSNIGNCPHACVARPCGLLAECVPQMESYECRCSAYNTQCNKAAEVPLEELQQNKAKNRSKSSDAKHGHQHEHEHAWKAKKTQANKSTAKLHHSKAQSRYLHKNSPHMVSGSSITTTVSPTSTTTTTTNAPHHEEDIEDDIIFRDVHGMHKRYGHNEGAQQRSSNANTQRNPKRKHISKQQSKSEHQHQHDTKLGPHYKYPMVERKLSRLPTHYERFETNPESDILTFDDNIALEANLRDYSDDQVDLDMESTNQDDVETKTESFVMDEKLFDEHDETEAYQRKQLAQDMQRIMANKQMRASKRPKLVVSEYVYSDEHVSDAGSVDSSDEQVADVNDDLLEPVQQQQTSASEAVKPLQTTPQTHTDWSLLKKLDLAADHQSHIGVRKSFGACFAGEDSYFHYNDADTMSQIISYNVDLNLRIKTHSHHGVILWTGRQANTEQDDDFLSLGIEDGYLHFRYNLGSGEVDIRFNMTKVSDGLWHRVRAIRDSQEGYLEVDGRKSHALRSPGKLRQLNTDTGLYVGGMPDVSYFTRRKYSSGIVGCISEIVLAGEMKLNFDPNTLGTSHNVETGIL